LPIAARRGSRTWPRAGSLDVNNACVQDGPRNSPQPVACGSPEIADRAAENVTISWLRLANLMDHPSCDCRATEVLPLGTRPEKGRGDIRSHGSLARSRKGSMGKYHFCITFPGDSFSCVLEVCVKPASLLGSDGESAGARTQDQRLKRAMLYQLSYALKPHYQVSTFRQVDRAANQRHRKLLPSFPYACSKARDARPKAGPATQS
jgi:hypothetical protein